MFLRTYFYILDIANLSFSAVHCVELDVAKMVSMPLLPICYTVEPQLSEQLEITGIWINAVS